MGCWHILTAFQLVTIGVKKKKKKGATLLQSKHYRINNNFAGKGTTTQVEFRHSSGGPVGAHPGVGIPCPSAHLDPGWVQRHLVPAAGIPQETKARHGKFQSERYSTQHKKDDG